MRQRRRRRLLRSYQRRLIHQIRHAERSAMGFTFPQSSARVGAMGMFDISAETEAEYREKFRQMAQEKVGEPVIAVAPFRRGGAASNFAISKSQIGGLFYAANSLRNKKKA